MTPPPLELAERLERTCAERETVVHRESEIMGGKPLREAYVNLALDNATVAVSFEDARFLASYIRTKEGETTALPSPSVDP